MRTALACIAAAGLILLQPSAGFAQNFYEDAAKAVFQKAIVKIEISVPDPVIKGGTNICDSQGTGFFITSTHVVTAAHVYALPEECGRQTLNIVLASNRFGFRKKAKVVKERDDIAILQSDSAFPDAMCSLGIRLQDAFDTAGYRLGIPGGLPDPAPHNVWIGSQASSFTPLVQLTGTAAEHGESGGPVLVNYNVVGVLKTKHLDYTGHSFMMTASKLRSLLAEIGISGIGKVCNPVEYLMSPDGRTILLQPDASMSATTRAAILKQIEAFTLEKASAENIKIQRVDDAVSVAVPDILLPQKTCRTILGINFGCTTTSKPVPNLSASANIAREIRDQVSDKILVETLSKMPAPPPQL